MKLFWLLFLGIAALSSYTLDLVIRHNKLEREYEQLDQGFTRMNKDLNDCTWEQHEVKWQEENRIRMKEFYDSRGPGDWR